ncbi:conserved hypothetical protein [Hyella patelloides LEGE 07179]|uniref:T6SS Phospholipase effector Tle1-like catalytic domain-containing protein n=1 Tax=Hyella patelloides LEGE 07179 TaxID=945734 RepID=A0A563VSS1_9CYAN|nr:DUF2235 domain-containing protein [Hyella patelloides]VEP14269.1 conserved hypothetical protein [Hyella patelloides LEGE 07179]VEP14436.1 conserved hypothetical protein [Hyella patelloides LEGE 07179]
MKRLIVCCDGTWQSQDNKVATNVLKIAQVTKTKGEIKEEEENKLENEIHQAATIKGKDKNNDEQKQHIPQILYYDQGIGAVPDYDKNTQKNLIDKVVIYCKRSVYRPLKIFGGAFGLGIDEKIEDAYIFLCLNYEPGDEIYLFGFSRGAYTVRSLAGLISYCGLLQRPDINHTAEAYRIYRIKNESREQKAENFRKKYEIEKPHIKFLGCWDTVGALGIPNVIPWLPIDRIFQRNLRFHDNKLSSIIKNARHAIAIDEKRSAFEVTMMESEDGFKGTLEQMCFPGDHGCVGGGTDEMIELSDNCKVNTLDLSKAALEWMVGEAKKLDLDLDLNLVKYPPEKTENRNTTKPKGQEERDIIKFKDLNKDFHNSVKELWCNKNYRPKNLPESIPDQLNKYCQSK